MKKPGTRLRLAAAVAAATCALGVIPAQAMVLQVGELYLNSGSITLGGSSSAFFNVNSNYNLVSGYFGAGMSGAPDGQEWTYIDPTAIAVSNFFGIPQNLYTAASNLGGGYAAAGTLAGGPVPYGHVDTVAGTIEINVSSFFVTWNGADYSSAGSLSDGLARGTWDPQTGLYSMSITSIDVGGATNGFLRTWFFAGSAVPVPEPSSYAYLLSGLAVTLVATRKRRLVRGGGL